MLSFMGQGQLGKLATFSCQKRISEKAQISGYKHHIVTDFFAAPICRQATHYYKL